MLQNQVKRLLLPIGQIGGQEGNRVKGDSRHKDEAEQHQPHGRAQQPLLNPKIIPRQKAAHDWQHE